MCRNKERALQAVPLIGVSMPKPTRKTTDGDRMAMVMFVEFVWFTVRLVCRCQSAESGAKQREIRQDREIRREREIWALRIDCWNSVKSDKDWSTIAFQTSETPHSTHKTCFPVTTVRAQARTKQSHSEGNNYSVWEIYYFTALSSTNEAASQAWTMQQRQLCIYCVSVSGKEWLFLQRSITFLLVDRLRNRLIRPQYHVRTMSRNSTLSRRDFNISSMI